MRQAPLFYEKNHHRLEKKDKAPFFVFSTAI